MYEYTYGRNSMSVYEGNKGNNEVLKLLLPHTLQIEQIAQQTNIWHVCSKTVRSFSEWCVCVHMCVVSFSAHPVCHHENLFIFVFYFIEIQNLMPKLIR